jgi:uncharacterized repeat protein (TIGR01451 family)
MRPLACVSLVLGLVSSLSDRAMAETGARSESVHDSVHHYLVFELDDDDGRPQAQSYQTVRLAEPRRSRSAADVAQRLADVPFDRERVGVALLDAGGRVVHRDVIDVPRWLRTEAGLHHAAGDEEPGVEPLVRAQRSFVVRVPQGAGARLELTVASRGREGSTDAVVTRTAAFDLADLARASLRLSGFLAEVEKTAVPPPNSGNRLDLLIMGDGYTAAQSAAFASHAATLAASFFSIPPYSTYQNFVNTATLFTASAQSGADHPPYIPSCSGGFPPTCCADPVAQSDPLAGTFVTTAFDAAYCSFNTHRLLVVDSAKVLTAAGANPDWDEIMVVVNDATYGGAGGFPSVVSTHAQAVGIAQHEFGHTFTGLADEYSSPYPGYPPCSDVTAVADCEANVTDQTVRPSIKWVAWIEAATPVPTPPTGFAGKVGLFQGARYLSSGMYKPEQTCLMNTLGVPFCRICRQEFVRRLYSGGWGIPAGGIDNIEPGSESPPLGTVSVSGPQTFTVALLAPAGGPALAVSWWVNGVVQPGQTGASFNFVPPATGSYQVEVRTHDQTTFVHPAMAGTFLHSSRAWTVNATISSTDLQTTQTASGTSVLPSQPLTITLVARNNGPLAVTAATLSDTVPSNMTGVTWTCAASAGSSCSAGGAGSFVDNAVNLLVGGTATYTITGTVGASARAQVVNTATLATPLGIGDANTSNNDSGVAVPVFKSLNYYTVAPCRLVDTRNAPGPVGGPALTSGVSRSFTVAGSCGVPATAWAVVVNATVTGGTAAGNLRLYPGATPVPTVSTVNYSAGQTRGNGGIVALGVAGDILARVTQSSGTAHLILDIDGYFDE